MALGVVLAIPKRDDGDSGQPQEQTLNDADFGAIRAAMQAGVDSGVFQLQLHGRSHYWLPALTEACGANPAVARWLAGPDTWRTEALPAGLQSRWAPEVGGAQFPISDDATRTAAEAEARLFQECFGTVAAVAVPTTFVWTAAVEHGWAAAGIRAVVTPGRHYRHRRQFDDPGSAPMITNGMRSENVAYVVRDQYFEPFKGHTAEDGLRALAANTALGRPALLEIHRVNYLEPALRERSLSAMRELLSRALETYPNLRFLSTVELVDAMEAEVADLIDRSMRGRIAAWCARVRTVPRFWRLARLSGLALLVVAAEKLALDRG
jgi:hypothetical protein